MQMHNNAIHRYTKWQCSTVFHKRAKADSGSFLDLGHDFITQGGIGITEVVGL